APSPLPYTTLFRSQSVAPATAGAGLRPGRPAPRGLNENYARELLELHTLGVDGGYSQKDVIEDACHLDHILLAITPVHAQCVQLEQLARVVLVEPARRGATRPQAGASRRGGHALRSEERRVGKRGGR